MQKVSSINNSYFPIKIPVIIVDLYYTKDCRRKTYTLHHSRGKSSIIITRRIQSRINQTVISISQNEFLFLNTGVILGVQVYICCASCGDVARRPKKASIKLVEADAQNRGQSSTVHETRHVRIYVNLLSADLVTSVIYFNDALERIVYHLTRLQKICISNSAIFGRPSSPGK